MDYVVNQAQEIANIMNDSMRKTSVCSIVSLDIIDFSVKSEAEKLALKTYFDSIVNQAVADIPAQDRIIVEAVNGVAIACNGPLEDALEDALFISLTIRDEILKHNTQNPTPLYVQIGINQGMALLANDADGKASLIGDGFEDAQRVMCFANPNQILVTRAYYEMASQLTHEISQMFDKYDMHTLEHDVYAVRLLKEGIVEETPSIPADISDLKPSIVARVNWRYVGSVMFGLLVFFVITKVGLEPTEPTITLDEPIVAENPNLPKSDLALDASIGTDGDASVQQTPEAISTQPKEMMAAAKPVEDKVVNVMPESAQQTKSSSEADNNQKKHNKVANKPESGAKLTVVNAEKSSANNSTKNADATSENNASKSNDRQVVVAARNAESKPEKVMAKEKSGWESFKEGLAKGAERNCTQGEIALNQCAKF